MTDRWFSDEELEQLSRPTMDRAIEAIDAGDLDEARRLCGEMKHEWQMLHDLMAAGVLDLVSFIQQRLGDEGVAEAWTESMSRGWRASPRRDRRARPARARRAAGGDLARPLELGRGAEPGRLHDHRGRREGHLHDEPLRLRPAARAQRRLRGPARRRRHPEAHDWSFGRKGFPLYCTHCTFMNESLPIQWSGYPLYPSDPPEDYANDPCTWYWYKDPDDIPERHWQRYGAVKPAPADGDELARKG